MLNFKLINGGFASNQSVKEACKLVDLNDHQIDAGGIPLICDGRLAYVLDKDTHTLVIGNTGSKKTRNYGIPLPSILAKSGESMIITDPKGEIYRYTKKALRKLEYEIVVLNFRRPAESSRWNPFSLIYDLYHKGNKDKAFEHLRDISKGIFRELSTNTTDVFWSNVASDYFFGLAQLLLQEGSKDEMTLENICNLNVMGNERFANSRYINQFYELTDKFSHAYRNLQGTIEAPNETKSSILSVFTSPLTDFISQDNLCDLMCDSDFEIKDLGLRKTVIFIIFPDEKTTYNSIITAFIKQCYQVLVDLAENEHMGRLPYRVNFILDEFGNLAKIDDMATKLSASRSRNIRFNLIIQSSSQLNLIYGKEMADIIMENCDTWIYLHTKDVPFLKRLSELCGGYTTEYSNEWLPLLSVAQLQRLSKDIGQVLILTSGLHPYIANLLDISAYCFAPNQLETIYLAKRKPKIRKVFDIRPRVQALKLAKEPKEVYFKQSEIDDMMAKIGRHIQDHKTEENVDMNTNEEKKSDA